MRPFQCIHYYHGKKRRKREAIICPFCGYTEEHLTDGHFETRAATPEDELDLLEDGGQT